MPFIYPWGLLPPAMVTRLEDLCHERGVSLFVSGIDPGWANDVLPFAVASTCQRVEKITCSEIADYVSYDGGPVLIEVMGFGRGVDDLPLLFKPGMLSAAWGVSLRQLAAGFDVEIDEITEWYERVPAPEAFDVTAGHIADGTVAAVRFTVTGMSAGRPVFVMDHITRLREDLCPDWPQPAQPGGSYRLEIEGEPSYRVDVCPSSRRGDHNYAAIAAGAGRVVNALPDVVTAPAGIRTTLDLPMPTGRGLFATTLGAAAVAEEDTPT
ncbi:hypothetical protein NCCP2495_30410 [Dietzia sp. NCCP-2495]|nr:hypothetical protein NCCP2495_30410 [Dietzia sp. NCCP-2495]